MRKDTGIGLALFLLLAALLSTLDVDALGVSPSRTTIDYKPHLVQSGTLTIHNTDKKDFRALIFARGELGEHIKFSDDVVTLKASEETKALAYTVYLPPKLNKAGAHVAEIVIRELPQSANQGEINVGALASVVSEVQVRVPYPGKYAETVLNVIGAPQNGDVRLFLLVSNLGEADLQSVKSTIHLYDEQNNLVGVAVTDEKGIKTRGQAELLASWKADVPLGRYTAKALVEYDQAITHAESTFVIGDFFIKLLDISVKGFSLGGIAKFVVSAENLAGAGIKDVHAEMSLEDERGSKAARLESLPADAPRLSKAEFELFWDTEGVSEGEYTGSLSLHHDDKSTEELVRVVVGKDKITAHIIGITGNVVAQANVESPSRALLSTMWIVLAAIVALLATNLAWLLYFKRREKPGS